MGVVLFIAGCGLCCVMRVGVCVGYCGMGVVLDNAGNGFCYILRDVGCVA